MQIFKLDMDRLTGDVSAIVIKTVFLPLQDDLHDFWIAASVYPKSYLPVLRNKFLNPFDDSEKTEIPEFSILSPFYDNFTIHYGDRHHGGGVDTLEVFKPRISEVHEFTEDLATSLIGGYTDRKSEKNVVVFFNEAWLSILYKKDTWIHQHLPSTLFDKDETLRDLEFQTSNFLILATDKHIYITLFSCIPAQQLQNASSAHNHGVWIRGSLEFTLLRKIPLGTFLPHSSNLRLTHCHFDMDLGSPYIFLSFDVPKAERTLATFQFMKIEFGSEQELGEEKCVENGNETEEEENP